MTSVCVYVQTACAFLEPLTRARWVTMTTTASPWRRPLLPSLALRSFSSRPPSPPCLSLLTSDSSRSFAAQPGVGSITLSILASRLFFPCASFNFHRLLINCVYMHTFLIITVNNERPDELLIHLFMVYAP